MRILLTNDDGYDAENIKSLCKELSINHDQQKIEIKFQNIQKMFFKIIIVAKVHKKSF